MQTFPLSQKARRTQPQPVTPLLAAALGREDLISLAVGFVDQETLPAREADMACRAVLSDPSVGRAALQYGTTQGLPALRQAMAEHIAGLEGTDLEALGLRPDQVVVTTGSQQGLYLLSDVLLDPGDIVIASAPSYFVYTAALTSFGADVRTVPVDEGGMRMDALEGLLARLEKSGELPRLKMVYVVPYYQNPTGLSLAVDRRPKLLELIRRFSREQRILILEDAAYRELRYEGDETPSIRSLDTVGEFVAMATSFSKALAPGLKTGCLLLPEPLVAPVVLQKGNHDFGSANFVQHVVAAMLRDGAYAAHVDALRDRYRRKRDTMLAGLEAGLADVPDVRWVRPEGGLYVWLLLPESIDTGPDGSLFHAALDHGVLYVPGEYCYVPQHGQPRPRNALRLCYGLPSLQDIEEGVRRLCRAVRAEASRGAAAGPR